MTISIIERKGIQEIETTYKSQVNEDSGVIVASIRNSMAASKNQLVINTDQCWNVFRALEKLRFKTGDEHTVVATAKYEEGSPILRGSHAL